MANNRLIYRSLALTAVFLAGAGALFAMMSMTQVALAVLCTAFALAPFVGHFRMREALAALRRSSAPATFTPNLQPLQEQLSAIQSSVAQVEQDLSNLKFSLDGQAMSGELVQAVDQIRRESRLARLAAAQIMQQF